MASEQGQNNNELMTRLSDYERKLQKKDKELEDMRKRMIELEESVVKVENMKNQMLKGAEEVDAMKTASAETLTKAKNMLFEKAKVIKNQELQIEAYKQQIDSLKDVVRITKDLLDIRNLEVKQLEGRLNVMDERTKAEREKQDLLHQKLESMIRYNGELKREYETQLCLFSALRERYSERELAKNVVDDLKKDLNDGKVTTNGQDKPAEGEDPPKN